MVTIKDRRALFKKNFLRNDFARGVSILVGGTIAAQGLSVLIMPLLTRLYSPEDFGLLAVFTAMLSFFSVVSAARYDLAIPLPENEIDVSNLVVLSIFIVAGVSLISFIFIYIFSDDLAEMLKVVHLADYFLIIPICVFFVGLYQVFSKLAVRQKKFKKIAQTTFLQSLTLSILQLGGYKLGVFSLVGGHTAAQGVAAISLIYSRKKRKFFNNISFNRVIQQAVRYKAFPLYSTGAALLNTASLQLAPLVFISLYGASVAGLYALTLRVLSIPVSLIGSSIGSVFLSEAPSAKKNGTLPGLVTKLHCKLSMFGSIPLIVLVLFGPDLFVFVFGEDWSKAGVYAQWMSPWLYLQLQWSPLSMLSSVLELQRAALIMQTMAFLSRFGVLVAAWYLGLSTDLSIFIFSLVSAFIYLFIMFWFVNKAGVSVLYLLTKSLKYIIFTLLFFLPVKYLFGG